MAEIELPKPEELEEIKAKRLTRRFALTTAIYAVILAISALGGNQAMKEMLLAQQQASDQWAFYQAKVIREHLDHGQKMLLELGLAERETLKPDTRKHYEELLKQVAAEEARYQDEKKELEQEAKKLEHERDLYHTKDPYFEYAEVLLQIAIVMSSIAILANSLPIFIFSLVPACLGTILTLNGYLLFWHFPFFHH
jgi:hypothetical protein